MMAMMEKEPHFITEELNAKLKAGSDKIWVLDEPLIYYSPKHGKIEVPVGFETDFASVPRIPVAYWLFGNQVHREPVLHDFAFRKGSIPHFTFMQANDLFLEAMTCRKKPSYVRYPMYWAVCAFSYPCFHKRRLEDKL